MTDDLSASIEAYVGGNVTPLPTLADRVRANMPIAMEAKPDYEADLQKAARATGVPLPSARNYPNEVTRRAKSDAFDYEAMAEETPAMASLFADLDKARVAHDDIPQLGAIEKGIVAFKRGLTGTLRGFDAGNIAGSANYLGEIDAAMKALDSGKAVPKLSFSPRGINPGTLAALSVNARGRSFVRGILAKERTRLQDLFGENAGEFAARGKRLEGLPASPAYQGFIESDSLGSALKTFIRNPIDITSQIMGESFGGMLPTTPLILAGAAGGVPGFMAATGASSFLTEYVNEVASIFDEFQVDMSDPAAVREAAASPEFQARVRQAEIKAGVVGAFDAATAGIASKTIGKTPLKNILAQTATQMSGGAAGEGFGSVASGQEVRPGAVLAEAIGEMPGGVADVSILKARERIVAKSVDASDTIASVETLSTIEQTAAQSKLRVRDPDAFREFLSKQTDGTPVEKLFIPAEKVVEYYQSQGMDWQSSSDFDFQTDFDDQMQQALATGGDIVVDTAGALTDLSGTDIWEALKPNARLSVDGMSIAEAQDFEAGRADELAKMDAEMSAQMEADRKAMEPRQRVFEDVRDQLMRSGMTPDVATTNAELLASRYATRAERLGTDIESEYAKSGLQVRQVLPEGLAPIVAADQLDMAIAAMKKRKNERSDSQKFGPSLAEFIAKRGGIEDRGGDLASRGANEWHKGKPGRRKLIRPHDDTGTFAGMKAGNVNTPDALAMAAWEAGYFPNLPDRPTVNDLLDALDNELRGQPVYAADNTTQNDELLSAADELERLLEQRGLDPAKATPKQIRDVVNEYQQEAEGRRLDQSFSDGPRGRIVFPAAGFGSGPSVIELFEARNLSTFIHESGHLFLEELRQDASDPTAPKQLRDDWAAIEKWFASEGVPVVDGVIPTEAHELWARGWERYTMEGKSPSSVLRKAFDAFKSWLLNIYQVVNNLKAPITPEIREVMDRLIATDEEIADARERQGLKALFSTAQEAGMSNAAFAEYQKAASESLDEAHDALLYRVMAEIRKRRTKEWKEQEASVRADVTAQAHARPEFKALHLLRTGKILGDPESPSQKIKLDRQWLAETYGQDALGLLPKGVPPIYADTGTTDADLIAEMTGFRTGDEMVRTLMAVEARKQEMVGDKRSVMNALIDEETAQIMRDRYGDPLSDGSIETEALAAVHNEKQGEVIAAEIRSLAQRAGRKPTPYQVAREWAKERVGASKVVDSTSRSAIQRYARAAAKAGKEAEAAMLKGDAEETLRQKQRQMLNNALVAEASKAADEVVAAVARLGKLAKRPTIKSIDQDHLDQVHQLLERYEFRQVSQTALNERESFEVWAAAQQAAGYDVISPDRLAAGKINWSRMTVEELKGLDEAIKQIVHLGRLKQKLLDAKEEREFNEIVDEGVASAGMLPPKPPSDLMEPSYWDSIKSRVADMDASLLKMETVFDWLDNKDPNGVFNRVVFRRIADAQDREKAMIQDYVTRLTDHLKAIPKKQLARWSEKVTAPELINRETGNPWVFTRDQLISIALNMGNDGNIQRLTDGYGWSEAGVMSALNRELTAEDWAYVQNVWDTIGTLWPEIAAMEKRLNGVEPEKVEAKPFETAHGSMKGGYFPAIYDPRKSLEAEAQAAKGSDLFENIYTRANTRAGATQNRADKVSRPIHLSLGVINRHITEVIHDITHREAIMDADRFLSDRRIMKAVDETLGPEVRKQFRPWLQHIANEYALDRRGVAGWDAFAKKLRTNTSIVGMGFRLSTIMLQVAGYSNSFERVGAKWVAPQLWKAFDPSAWSFVLERSNEVRNRMETMERDIRENVKAVLGKHDILSDARRFAFHGIGYMDRAVVIPTWLGAYNRGISEGMSDADAVYFADKAVRQSQGAGAAKDLAAVQRSNEWMRLATMFYSYQAAVYQRFRTLGRDIRRTQDLPDLIARSFWLVIVPPLLSELLAGRGPGDDDDWGMWAFQNMLVGLLGPIPIARDVAGAMKSGFGYSFTPAARAFETGMNVVKDIEKIAVGEETKRAARNALEVSGYALGLPTGQLATAVQFIVDVSEGEQDPQTVGDWFTGLSKGKLPEE